MKTLISEWDLQTWRSLQGTEDIGFVPTMGGLHEGHLALVAQARARHARVVASIYVNPLQFGPQEDFAAYPRTPEADLACLLEAGVDAVFLPTDSAIYPQGRERHTQVWVPGLSEGLCGHFRPGHFQGVTTVVARLFGLVRPRTAYFGKKDYQQWRVIERMTADLAFSMAVVGIDTVRETDGLAKSTRNQYLSAADRARAGGLYQVLLEGARAAIDCQSFEEIEKQALRHLEGRGFSPEYVAIRRADDLATASLQDEHLVILGAARLGATRLIDNWEFSRL